MNPELSDDEQNYKNDLARLTAFSQTKLGEWKTASTTVADIQTQLSKFGELIKAETEAKNEFINARSGYLVGKDKAKELDKLIKEADARISKLQTSVKELEGLIPAKKIEMISARRRFRTSQESIEILERNYLKTVVGKAKRRPKQLPQIIRPIQLQNQAPVQSRWGPPIRVIPNN